MSFDVSALSNLSLGKSGQKKDAPDGVSILSVHPDELYVTKQVRDSLDPDRVKELAQSIDENGLQQPLKVYPKSEKGYLIHNGENRWQAMKLLGKTSIPIIVDTSLSLIDFNGEKIRSAKAVLAQAADNINRDDLKPFEISDTIFMLTQEPYKMSKGAIGKAWGRPSSWISRYVKLLNAPDSVIELCKSKVCQDAETLGVLVKIYEADKATFEVVMAGGSFERKGLESLLKTIKNPPKQTENTSVKNDTSAVQNGSDDESGYVYAAFVESLPHELSDYQITQGAQNIEDEFSRRDLNEAEIAHTLSALHHHLEKDKELLLGNGLSDLVDECSPNVTKTPKKAKKERVMTVEVVNFLNGTLVLDGRDIAELSKDQAKELAKRINDWCN
ncbi:ParB/RepB/Spo0J family partition protein [Enterovibrio calviensis]|uniref:ParB/RepB/Spo0J family partition protein n=1 Tax=Enterovibrio calviensis TaxID=91359 RepID=UPI00373605EC